METMCICTLSSKQKPSLVANEFLSLFTGMNYKSITLRVLFGVKHKWVKQMTRSSIILDSLVV